MILEGDFLLASISVVRHFNIVNDLLGYLCRVLKHKLMACVINYFEGHILVLIHQPFCALLIHPILIAIVKANLNVLHGFSTLSKQIFNGVHRPGIYTRKVK